MSDPAAVIGNSIGWEPFECAQWRVERVLDASGLTAKRYRLDGPDGPEGALVPPSFLSAQYVDAFALGIPDAPARLNGGNSVQWLADVHVGDRLERRSEVTDVKVKEGRTGRLQVYTVETVYRRVDTHEEVARLGYTPIRRYPLEGAGSSSGGGSSAGVPEGAKRVFTTRATPRQTVRYAVATEDLYEAHYDLEFAKASGLPGTIVHGLLKMAWLVRGALEFAGEGATVRELSVSYRGMDLVGEDVTVWAEPDPDAETDGALRLYTTSAGGQLTTVGSGVVA